MSTAQTHVYKHVDGIELKVSVFGASAGRSETKLRPTIVWLHGGALILGTRHDLLRTRQDQLAGYLHAGWIVVSVDYRLAPETQLPAIWEDVRDAFAWVRGVGPQLIGADPNRVAVVGASCGGYLALLAGAKLEPPPRAVVSFFGYGDITGDWYSKPDPYYLTFPAVTQEAAWAVVGSQPVAELPTGRDRRQFYLYLRQQGLWPSVVGGRHALEGYCPDRLATLTSSPTLLIHGDADTDVPHEQSLSMARALRAVDVPCEVNIVPGAPHSFDRKIETPVARKAIADAVAFLRGYLG